MSFSSEVKEELSKIHNLANKANVKAEFIGYLISNNINIEGKYIKYSTENEYNINRLNKLLNNLFIEYKFNMQGKSYFIKIKKKDVLSKIEEIYIRSDINKIYINQDINFSDQEKRSIIRGTFLGGGTFNNPNNTYYIEMILSTYENAEYIHKLLIEYNILTKFLVRKKGFSVYTKSAEEISKILALMGSNKAVLNFEEIRVVKETRNNVNRIINCETANLNKIVNASVKQIEDIKYLKEKNEFKYLPDS